MPGPEPGRAPGGLAAMMRRRDPVVPLIREFNLSPSRYMHASWADALFTPVLWDRLRQSRRAEAHLNRLILQDLGVAGTFPAEAFADMPARLALLDGAALDRLALHLGLVVDGAPLRHVITRDEVHALRDTLGPEGYAFAVQRAPLLKNARRAARPAGPVRLDDPPPGGGEADAGTDTPLPDRLRAAGLAVLGAALAGLPRDILKRFRLKLPRDTAPDFTRTGRFADAASLSIRVVKETEPRWASLFAPQTA